MAVYSFLIIFLELKSNDESHNLQLHLIINYRTWTNLKPVQSAKNYQKIYSCLLVVTISVLIVPQNASPSK